MHTFDSIIVGAGAAGLSLAYHLGQAGLGHQRVLLIDQVAKNRNDRTWCFWEADDGPFEALVSRSWDHLWIHDQQRSRRVSIAPYRYKMLQGIDFYTFMQHWLTTQPTITRLQGHVQRIEERPDGVTVHVDGQAYHGNWAFNSIYSPPPQRTGYTFWLQHFKGWIITTPEPVFDPGAATFMDFRVEQTDDVRFVYVLPFDAHTALVEFTLFSPALVEQAEYDAGLRRYIHEWLGITSYAIQHIEYGVIPMTDLPFVQHPSPHVINIGTAGGMTKASTGYTFQRIQKQSRAIVESLRDAGHPVYRQPAFDRYALLDSILLHVLDTRREGGRAFFSRLFRTNSPQRVLRFLDEATSPLEDLALMSTVNLPAFIGGTLALANQRIRFTTRQKSAATLNQ